MQVVVVEGDTKLRNELPLGIEWALDAGLVLERLSLPAPTGGVMYGVESATAGRIKTETFTSVERARARASETARSRTFIHSAGSGVSPAGPFSFAVAASEGGAANSANYRFMIKARQGVDVRSGVSWTQIGPGAREVLRDLVVAMDASFACVVHDGTAVSLMGAFGYLDPHTYPAGSAIYSWISFLPPEAVEALGGVERVRADAPVAWLEPVELERGPGVLAQLDEDPAASEPARWAEWAGYLEPVLPPRRPEHAFYRLYPDWVLPEHRMERPFPRREDTPPQ